MNIIVLPAVEYGDGGIINLAAAEEIMFWSVNGKDADGFVDDGTTTSIHEWLTLPEDARYIEVRFASKTYTFIDGKLLIEAEEGRESKLVEGAKELALTILKAQLIYGRCFPVGFLDGVKQ